jgi:hypothetical protein
MKDDITQLIDEGARLVRREANRAIRELTPGLCQKYSELCSDEARRKFYQSHRENLKDLGGLIGVCVQSAKPLSSRARAELKILQLRPSRGMARFAFDRLRPDVQMAYIQAGGKVTDS